MSAFNLEHDAFEQLERMAQEYVEKDVLPTIVDRAKRIVPVDTGELRDHISAVTSSEGNFVVADTEYAAFVELGTSKQAAQPYLRPSMTSALPEKSGK